MALSQEEIQKYRQKYGFETGEQTSETSSRIERLRGVVGESTRQAELELAKKKAEVEKEESRLFANFKATPSKDAGFLEKGLATAFNTITAPVRGFGVAADFLAGGAKKVGQQLGEYATTFTPSYKGAVESTQNLQDMRKKLADKIVEQKKAGKDTSDLELVYKQGENIGYDPIKSLAIMTKTKGQLAGEWLEFATDVASLGTGAGGLGKTFLQKLFRGVPVAMSLSGAQSVARNLQQGEKDLGKMAEDIAVDAGSGGVIAVGLNLLGMGLPKLWNGIKSTAKEAWGKATGSGRETIEEALSNPKVRDYAREAYKAGDDFVDDTLKQLQDNISDVKGETSAEYIKLRNKITSSVGAEDLQQVKTKALASIDDIASQNRIKITDAGVDVSKSKVISSVGRKDIKNMITAVNTWDDWTFNGVDDLERTLQATKKELVRKGENNAARVVGELHDSVRKEIESIIPDYSKMKSTWASGSGIVDEIESAFKLNGKDKQVAINKIFSLLKKDKTAYRTIVEKLGVEKADDLFARVAGYNLKNPFATGLVGDLFTKGGSVAAVINPSMIPTVLGVGAVSSPRLAAELTSIINRITPSQLSSKIPAEIQGLLKNWLYKAQGEYFGKENEKKPKTENKSVRQSVIEKNAQPLQQDIESETTSEEEVKPYWERGMEYQK